MQPNTALTWCHHNTVTASFMSAVVHNVLLADQGKLVGAVHAQPGGIIASARNKCVEWFLESTDLSWLWFVDADMGIGPNTLEDLLDAGLEPCVASAATWSPLPGGRALTWALKDEKGGLQYVPDVEAFRVPIDACGMACTLVHRQVLGDLKERYPHDPWHWFGHDMRYGTRYGEDYTFCFRVRDAGFPIYGVDTLVPHYKLMPL